MCSVAQASRDCLDRLDPGDTSLWAESSVPCAPSHKPLSGVLSALCLQAQASLGSPHRLVSRDTSLCVDRCSVVAVDPEAIRGAIDSPQLCLLVTVSSANAPNPRDETSLVDSHPQANDVNATGENQPCGVTRRHKASLDVQTGAGGKAAVSQFSPLPQNPSKQAGRRGVRDHSQEIEAVRGW